MYDIKLCNVLKILIISLHLSRLKECTQPDIPRKMVSFLN